MANFRYWRLGMMRVGSTTVLPVSAFELYDTSGGTDKTGSGTASARTGTAANAFDRNSATNWIDSGVAGDYITWLQYDFGSPTSIDQVIVRGSTTVGAVDVATFIVVSNDLTTWSTAGVVQNLSHLAASTLTFDTTTAYAPPVTQASVKDLPTNGSWSVNIQLTKILVRPQNPDNGPGYIAGTVDITGTPATPVQRKVRAYSDSTGMLARETWSDPVTGEYRLDGLASRPFYVVALDYQLNYNAVVKDNVVPT